MCVLTIHSIRTLSSLFNDFGLGKGVEVVARVCRRLRGGGARVKKDWDNMETRGRRMMIIGGKMYG